MEHLVDLVSMLKSKKVTVTEIPKWGTYLRRQWEESFASHLSNEGKEMIYLHNQGRFCGYLWHLFSYEKKDCLQQEKADKAFNGINKRFCYVFYQHSDDALIIENATSVTADDFIEEQDVYVVDKGFNWTYVRTHETGWCGPYFSRKDK